MIFVGGDIESDFAGFVGFFTILFTGLAHLIFKIVSVQEGLLPKRHMDTVEEPPHILNQIVLISTQALKGITSMIA